jgi:hypothetical protein
MKLKTLTGACLLAFAAPSAMALNPATTVAASTVQVYASGASAQINSIGGLFGTMCVGGTLDTYVFSGNVRGYSCTIAAGVSALAGKNVYFMYNADGGSGNGVYPIAKLVNSGGTFTSDPAAQRPQIVNPATCTLTGTPNTYTCTSATLGNRWSDAGVSDVEPAMFKFDLNKPAAFASTALEDFEIANLDVGSQFQVIFGIAASNNLYDDLAAAQGLSTGAGQVPSIPRTALISLYTGQLADPSSGLGWQALFTPGTLPGGSAVTGPVNIGRRVNGSGTQTAANAFFQGYGCVPTANLVPADASFTNPGSIVVNEGSGTSNVIAFVNARFAAGEYAIGLVSKENAPGGSDNWKHIAIDGQVPSRDNAKNGKYDYVYEQTMQWNTPYLDGFRTLPVGSGGAGYTLPVGVTVDDLKSFLTSFRVRSGNPIVLDSIASSAVKEGIAAIANFNEGYIFNDPAVTTQGLANKKFVSRMTRNGNSCQPLLWNN